MSLLRRSLSWIGLAAMMASAQAIDFRSVGPSAGILYDAPGPKSKKMYVAPLGMPLELVITNTDWSRVRDASGEFAWIENKFLSQKRMLVVEATQASVRAAPSDTAAIAFSAARGVLLELAEPAASGWLRVRHRDGDSGYVKATDVWGE
jgi:SH3-like domain-containing protein